MIQNKSLKRRIIETSWKHKLAHLGSCLTAVDIIKEIYDHMHITYKTEWDDRFILSAGHAGLALYVVLEKFGWGNAEEMLEIHGIHPNRDLAHGIYVSTGSLGQGLPIALGMALADRRKNVYCLISDGECNEGSIAEALRIQREQALSNLKVYINANGWGAYRKIEMTNILNPLVYLGPTIVYTNMNDYPTWLQGQEAHYVSMNEEQYREVMEILK